MEHFFYQLVNNFSALLCKINFLQIINMGDLLNFIYYAKYWYFDKINFGLEVYVQK